MLKKITLPLLMAGAVLGYSSYASADLLYVGLGGGVSLTSQDQGNMSIGDNRMPTHLKSQAGSISGSVFGGFTPMPFLSLEGDLEFTEMTNKIKQPTKWEQAVFGDKPLKISTVTPLFNVVVHTPTFSGIGLFALAGAGGSYSSTTITSDNPKYKKYNDADYLIWGNDYNSYDDYEDDNGNEMTIADKFSKFKLAYDVGVGIFYQVPSGVNLITVSGGFRYINLGGKNTQAAGQGNFDLKASSKEEVFLRVQVGL